MLRRKDETIVLTGCLNQSRKGELREIVPGRVRAMARDRKPNNK